MFSILEMFTIGVGPSSSHTVGPMVAASRFAASLERDGILNRVGRVRTVLYGSLALTGLGHGTDRATVAGLEGNVPKTVDTDHMSNIRMECEAGGELMLNEKDQEAAPEILRLVKAQTGKQLTLAKETAEIPGGFILRQGAVEINCALDVMMRLLEGGTAHEVAALLF